MPPSVTRDTVIDPATPVIEVKAADEPVTTVVADAPEETQSDQSGSSTVKPAYPPPAQRPTQAGPKGIRFDFNLGARLLLPDRKQGEWLARLYDIDTGNVLFESRNKGALIASSKRFYVRFRLEVFEGEELVFKHEYDCRNREVLIQFPVGTLGDTMAWFPYAARFGEVHGCKLTFAMSGLIIPLVKDQYPDITFVTHEEVVEQKLTETFYASYCLGLFFDDTANIWQPTDFRMVGLHRTAGYILGVDPARGCCRR